MKLQEQPSLTSTKQKLWVVSSSLMNHNHVLKASTRSVQVVDLAAEAVVVSVVVTAVAVATVVVTAVAVATVAEAAVAVADSTVTIDSSIQKKQQGPENSGPFLLPQNHPHSYRLSGCFLSIH
jgi:hypothetical protein